MKTMCYQVRQQLKQNIRAVKEKAKNDIKELRLEYLTSLAHVDTRIAAKLKSEHIRLENEKKPKRYTQGEEIFNSISHGIGAGLAIAGLVLLLIKGVYFAPKAEMGIYLASYAIYGASLIILYVMSTLYHALTPYGVKKLFATFDHTSIYLLISGTYTPFCLTVLPARSGWWIFGIIWGLTVTGITFYSIFGNRIRVISVLTYVLMGWLIIVVFGTLKQNLPVISIRLLILGGVAYTGGVIFYSLKKIRWMHCIWHLFVIAGSILHYFSIYFSF